MAQFSLHLKTLAALVAFLVLCASAHAAEGDKGVLADLISRALSSPSTNVSIGAVDGVLSSDASISDIVLSDRQGRGSRSTRFGSFGTDWRCSAGGWRSTSLR
jgi:translocation and assembly module TamB